MISFPNIMLSVLQGLPLHIKRVNCRVVYSMMYFQLSDDLLWSEESENRCGFFLPCATLLALIFSRHNLMIITDICLAVIMLGFPGGSDNKRNCLQCRRPRFNPWAFGQMNWILCRANQAPLPLPSELRRKCKGLLVDYEALDNLRLPPLQLLLS